MIGRLSTMLRTLIERHREIPMPPEIEVTPDDVKERIEAEREETRRELARLQLRALRLATEYRKRGDAGD